MSRAEAHKFLPPHLDISHAGEDISETRPLCSFAECKRVPRLKIVFVFREGITKAHYCFEHAEVVLRGYPNTRITSAIHRLVA